jgi:hypothetical protein
MRGRRVRRRPWPQLPRSSQGTVRLEWFPSWLQVCLRGEPGRKPGELEELLLWAVQHTRDVPSIGCAILLVLQECLPALVRVCLRRVERHGVVDVPGVEEGGL